MFTKCHLALLILIISQVSAQCNNMEQIIESTLFGTIRLQSPGYNHGYQRNLLCRWIINFYDNNSTAFIRAHFVGLLTTQDVVRIYTGPNETAVALDSSVNPSADRTVITTVSVATMMLVFVTDNHTENDGVGFDMKIMESIDLSGSGCFHNEILEAQDTIQYLTSPNFPDLYEKNSNCEWTLTATSMSEVNVSIVFVNLDFVGSKCYHYLRLVGFGDFCKTFESDSTTDTYNYSASSINVKFHSDNVNAKTGSGFVIKYVKHNISIEDTTPQATTFVTTEKLPGVTTMLAAHHISTEEVTTYKTSKLSLVYNTSTVLANEATTTETNPMFGRTTAQSTAWSSTKTQNPTAANENKYLITGTSSPAHTETKLSTVDQSTKEGESIKQPTHEQPSVEKTSIEHGTSEVSSFNKITTEITTNTFKPNYVTSSSSKEKTLSEEFTKTLITTEQNTATEDLPEETISMQTTTAQTTALEITREQTTAERVTTEQPVTVAPTTDAFTTEPTTIREHSTGQTTKQGTFPDDNTTLEFTTERTTREEIKSKQTTTAEITIEQTTTTEITSDKTSVKITVEQSTTSQMPTEQGTTAKIANEQTTTADITTEQTTRESTTKESTMATIANDQTSTTMTTVKASMNDTTSEQITTEHTSTADITTTPITPESTIKESTMATITNDQTTTAMTTAPTTKNNNTSEQITTEGSVNKLKITGASTTVQTTTANITTDQTSLKEVNTERMTTEEDTVKETTSTTKTITTDGIHKKTIQSEVTLAETTLEELTTAHTTPALIRMEGTTVDITTDQSSTNLPIDGTSKMTTDADLTKVEVITLVTTVQTSIGTTTKIKTNQRTSEEATTKYASKEQFTKTEGTIIKTEQTTSVFITSEQTTTKPSTPEYTTISLALAETLADHVTTAVLTADHKTASENITELVTPGLTIRAENINQTIMEMPSDGVTTVTTKSSIETIKTEDETTIQITTIKQHTTGNISTERHTTEQRQLKTTVTTLTTDFTDIQATTTTSSYLNTFNPTTALKDGNQTLFSDLLERNVSETSVVGIVVGGLVTMAILVVTLSVAIYAFVLKRDYSKNKLFDERYGIFPYRSSKSSAELTSNLPSDLTSNSSQNIIPKWVSMFDAFRMSGYNPTFQPPNDISQKVLKIPKWVQMMDAFEKSGHLQTFWEEVKHKET